MPPVIFALRLGFGAGIDREAIKTAPECFAPMHANVKAAARFLWKLSLPYPGWLVSLPLGASGCHMLPS
jgi:hypothetical protein